jgi:CotH kinase protein
VGKNDDEQRAGFFEDRTFYDVRITGWDPDKVSPAALADDQSTRGAKLEVFALGGGADRPRATESRRRCDGPRGTRIYEGAGFSLRTSGNLTKGTPKSSYKIKLPRDGAAERLCGMRALNLKSMWNDVSQMREALAWDLFAKARVPAPRHTYATLCINDRYFGLYSVIEDVDKGMLGVHFGDNDEGNLYKAHWNHGDLGPADLTYRASGDDDGGSQYKRQKNHDRTYELDTNDDEPDKSTYEDLATLIRVLHGKTLPADAPRRPAREGRGASPVPWNAPEYRARMEEILDVKSFLRWAGVNALLGAWDNYWGTPANYFLYNGGRGKKNDFMAKPFFHWIPWDYDHTFGIDYFSTAWQHADLVRWEENTRTPARALPLITHLLENDDFLRYYLDHLEFMLERYFNEAWITARIGDEAGRDGLWQLVRGPAFQESDNPTSAPHTGRRFSNDQIYWNGYRHFELAQGSTFALGILHYVRMRYDDARRQIAALRARRDLGAPTGGG